ncbi:MAG: hypothetical protein J7502_05510 [Flavisolibacter sp.]|nr:hypothetical protein [Flavisolibacter sp.]
MKFRASRRSVTIEVTCDNGIIEIKSLNDPLYNKNGNKAFANEKALLTGYLIDQCGKVTQKDLENYFNSRGWKISLPES